jgi:hypothetical protein
MTSNWLDSSKQNVMAHSNFQLFSCVMNISVYVSSLFTFSWQKIPFSSKIILCFFHMPFLQGYETVKQMYENGTLADKLKKETQQTAKERAESSILQVRYHF